MTWAMHYLEEYNAAVVESQPQVALVIVTTWSPPPPISYKLNVNGATFSAQKAMGIGVVVRDD